MRDFETAGELVGYIGTPEEDEGPQEARKGDYIDELADRAKETIADAGRHEWSMDQKRTLNAVHILACTLKSSGYPMLGAAAEELETAVKLSQCKQDLLTAGLPEEIDRIKAARNDQRRRRR